MSLDGYRLPGGIPDPQVPPVHPQVQPYAQQLPGTTPVGAHLGAAGYGQVPPYAPQQQPPPQQGLPAPQPGLPQPPYPNKGLYMENASDSGYQWVDGPGANPTAAPPAASYPLGDRAVQQAPQAQPQPGMYPYQQAQPPTQWVDNPQTQAAPPAPQQDMVFQWVDSPQQGHLAHRQPYMQAQVPSPYYQDPYGAPRAPDAAARGSPLQQPPIPGGSQVGLGGHPPPHGVVDPYHHQQGAGRYPQSPDVVAYEQHRQAMEYNAYQQNAYMGQPPPPQGGYPPRRDMPGDPYNQGRPPYMPRDDQHRGAGDREAGRGRGRGGGMNDHGGRNQMGQAKGLRQSAQDDGGKGGRGRTSGKGGESAAGRSSSRPAEAAAADAGSAEGVPPERLRPMLTSVLESLYEDRIKPMTNYVKGRLKERNCPEGVVKNFVDLYAEHRDLFIVQRPTHSDEEAIVFLVTEPSWFKGWLDIDSPDDPYDEVLWAEFAKFLNGEHTFAGGRYGMARELMQRNLPFLAGLSLGEVCHIVQLAIQHRRLIVYHRKMLKPIQAVLQQPAPLTVPGTTEASEEITDMDDLCMVLFRMLWHHPSGLRLCRLKQMIKHEFNRKLSEMSFQCTKLIELFNQEPLTGTFVLDTENDGKSIYIRLGNPESFTEHVKTLYNHATTTEAKAFPAS
mmetsp:Transcript_76035/g.180960  ORF Transcript_76035/g.180960 Transcript_76035/m.180960 type:complete len:670 (-) Transcript_76035:63-2072(-)